MSHEKNSHISTSEAVFATLSGALLGAGLFVPPLGGLGLTVGAIGVLRVRSHERDNQLEEFSSYLKDSFDDRD